MIVAKNCTAVSPHCPVEASVYAYVPSLGANVFFAFAFGICGIANLGLGIYYKTWTYGTALVIGCFCSVVGYSGRIMMHSNPFGGLGFVLQICFLIVAPAFNSAALYLTLKHIVLCFGERWSRLRPKLYTYLFISGDVISIGLQGIGGGRAAKASNDHDAQASQKADRIIVTGVVFQVCTLAIFFILFADYILRRRRAHRTGAVLDPEAEALLTDRKFRMFMYGQFAVFWLIFIRCIYRVAEMAGGWRNPIMLNQAGFIVLEGIFILLATCCQTFLHPGYCFPYLSSRRPIGSSIDRQSQEIYLAHVK